ncbi:MAG: vitamin B12 dependent-methionine synthase activation domain-containing protein, partial [Planctomycetota bacterium]
TPSLDEMAHVASEMQRQGFTQPLLIGGATTSSLHTAVKIAPCYDGVVEHVLDASRVSGVCSALLGVGRDEHVRALREKQERDRQRFQRSGERAVELVPLDAARERRVRLAHPRDGRPQPGLQIFRPEDIDLQGILRIIDWSPFFWSWELKGTYPAIFEHAQKGEQARQLWADMQPTLDRLLAGDLLRPRAVIGHWPANARGDDIVLWQDEQRDAETAVLPFLRQQDVRNSEEPCRCLADYLAPETDGVDWCGAFAVTAGPEVEAHAQACKAAGDDYQAIMVQALADRFAEGLAEWCHRLVRDQYGIREELSVEDLIAERYRGIRPAPGYPACPDHTTKGVLWRLLQADKHTGMRLTESFAMQPPASVSGLYLYHPEARYFSVKRIARDQVVAYAARQGWDLATAERWMAPVLGYDPQWEPVTSA